MVEVLVGISLGATVIAGMAAATVGSIQTTATSNQITAASALVHDKIEQLRALDPATNPADLAVGDHIEPALIDQLGNSGGSFKRTWTVTEDTPIPGVSQIAVSVSWSGPYPRAVTGLTFVCETSGCV